MNPLPVLIEYRLDRLVVMKTGFEQSQGYFGSPGSVHAVEVFSFDPTNTPT